MTLAKLLRQQGSYERSLALARQVLDIRQRKLGEDHPATMDAAYLTAIDETKLTDTVAGLATVQGEIERVVRMRRELFGADNPQTVSAMTGLVAVLIKAGDKADDDRVAATRYGEAIAIEHTIVDSHERMLGPDHPNTLLAHGSLASILQRAGRYREAEAEARYTLAAQERVLGQDHPIVSGTLNLIGDICRDAGNLSCARDAYRDALTRRAALMGPLAAHTIESASSLYEVLARMHQSAQAADIRARYLRQVIEMDPATLDASMRSVRDEAIRVAGR
jgi:serine/threonine-protein kinase